MTRLENCAIEITSAQSKCFTALNEKQRYSVMKDFYSENSLEVPTSITLTTTKRLARLTQKEKDALRDEYINALESGVAISEEFRANIKAIQKGEYSDDAKITLTETKTLRSALTDWGERIVADKMKDALSVQDREKFDKIRSFNVPAEIAINEIPKFIEALQGIYDKAQK